MHPSGMVKPDDPNAKFKFLAADVLCGVGSLALDANGKRFANVPGRRDYVTGEVWKNRLPLRHCLDEAASDEIIWHCMHYTGRGVMNFYENGAALAQDTGVPVCARKLPTNSSSSACVGLIYEVGGKDEKEYGPVILASGAFGADFTQNPLLARASVCPSSASWTTAGCSWAASTPSRA